ncbi:YitT family protein [Lacticaseibacillus brantae]|nr:YitT family protein [Lacticaseibacillus brantae]
MRQFLNRSEMKPVIMLVALEIIALSINLFFAPHGVAAGGATGIAILVQELANVPVGLTTLAVNAVMLVLAWFLLDRATTKRILLGSVTLPILLAVTPQIMIVQDRLLAIIVGSVVFAIGVAMLYRIDASSGGTTVPPLIFKKYFGLKPAIGLLGIDLIVASFNLPVAGTEAFILAIFSIVLTSIVMNYVETGLDRKKAVYIMSTARGDAVKQNIQADLAHGMTIQHVTGGFSNDQREMLMVVVEQTDFKRLVDTVHAADPEAFMLVTEATEVHGGSFV